MPSFVYTYPGDDATLVCHNEGLDLRGNNWVVRLEGGVEDKTTFHEIHVTDTWAAMTTLQKNTVREFVKEGIAKAMTLRLGTLVERGDLDAEIWEPLEEIMFTALAILAVSLAYVDTIWTDHIWQSWTETGVLVEANGVMLRMFKKVGLPGVLLFTYGVMFGIGVVAYILGMVWKPAGPITLGCVNLYFAYHIINNYLIWRRN